MINLRKASVKRLKKTELRLIFELMKNSRRSDRTLAKALHVSQPTVSRMLARLWKEGIIKEYTMIPDLSKLGFTLLAVTLIKPRANLPAEATAEARTRTKRDLEQRKDIMMLERGIGMGSDGVILSVHKDYSEFLDMRKWLEEFLGSSDIQSFLVNLQDEARYRPLTLSLLGEQLLQTNQ